MTPVSLNSSRSSNPDSKVHGTNMGPIWGRQDPGGPHVGPMNLVIWEYIHTLSNLSNHGGLVLLIWIRSLLQGIHWRPFATKTSPRQFAELLTMRQPSIFMQLIGQLAFNKPMFVFITILFHNFIWYFVWLPTKCQKVIIKNVYITTATVYTEIVIWAKYSLPKSVWNVKCETRPNLIYIIAYTTPRHYVNQCWVIINWTLRDKIQWNFNRNKKLVIHENASEYIVCKMTATLSREGWVKYGHGTFAVCNFSKPYLCSPNEVITL